MPVPPAARISSPWIPWAALPAPDPRMTSPLAMGSAAIVIADDQRPKDEADESFEFGAADFAYAPDMTALPEGWEVYLDPISRSPWFWHTTTEVASWEHPNARSLDPVSEPEPPVPKGWEVYRDPIHRCYWFWSENMGIATWALLSGSTARSKALTIPIRSRSGNRRQDRSQSSTHTVSPVLTNTEVPRGRRLSSKTSPEATPCSEARKASPTPPVRPLKQQPPWPSWAEVVQQTQREQQEASRQERLSRTTNRLPPRGAESEADGKCERLSELWL